MKLSKPIPGLHFEKPIPGREVMVNREHGIVIDDGKGFTVSELIALQGLVEPKPAPSPFTDEEAAMLTVLDADVQRHEALMREAEGRYFRAIAPLERQFWRALAKGDDASASNFAAVAQHDALWDAVELARGEAGRARIRANDGYARAQRAALRREVARQQAERAKNEVQRGGAVRAAAQAIGRALGLHAG